MEKLPDVAALAKQLAPGTDSTESSTPAWLSDPHRPYWNMDAERFSAPRYRIEYLVKPVILAANVR